MSKPPGVTQPESLRLNHVLSESEIQKVNAAMRQHGVSEFVQPCQVADLVDRVRWLGNDHAAHVLRELARVLAPIGFPEGDDADER